MALTPREEEPQIVVPMVDVLVSYPGASPAEVETRVTTPMEELLWQIKGVEYVYSIVSPGANLTIVRFKVGEDQEDSLVKLYNKLMAHYDELPPGVSQPLVKPRSIDDVPILSLTLFSANPAYSGYELRRLAGELAVELRKGQQVAECQVIGGQRRQVRVALDSQRLRAHGLDALAVLRSLDAANRRLDAGVLVSANRETAITAGNFIGSLADLRATVVHSFAGRPVRLGEVAEMYDGPAEPENYVLMGLGPGYRGQLTREREYEAVTIALSKQQGANAASVADEALRRVAALRGKLLPADVQVRVTRNYGATATDKSDELIKHMLIATLAVVVLIAVTMGWRAAVVVAVAVPVTLALTLLINHLYGYTLNRVTLFALIFSIGILVDDAIVVVENIHRHFRLTGFSRAAAVAAVDEVGNPTILATLAVIAALLPMAFVSGLMGPYMRPIPVGASAAMLFSLLVAFIVSPWLACLVLQRRSHGDGGEAQQTALQRRYGRLMDKLVASRQRRLAAYGLAALLFGLALACLPLKLVTVKLLPFDNKSELELVLDLPEGATLEETTAVAQELGHYLRRVPEVLDYQIYAGAAAPYNFNGLVRHYFLRSAANEADIQVNFVDRHARQDQSHALAKRLRPPLAAIAERHGARLKLAEVPPGPPVLSTLVAEVYGPDPARRIAIAGQVRRIFENTPGVVDVDWYVDAAAGRQVLRVDQEKAALHGIPVASVAEAVRVALSGATAGLMHLAGEREPVEIRLRLPRELRGDLEQLKSLSLIGAQGEPVALAELVSTESTWLPQKIYHKNLKPVTYVIGDVAGREESPVYAILKMRRAIEQLRLPEGYGLRQYSSVQPWLEERYSLKWDGEWHITYEVFRDLGIAFAAVLVLIYVLVVAWFRSFATPLVIMAPIPLTLVGILPGHFILGAFFTATSMIGFIALAGIVVRNSLLLVDFIGFMTTLAV
ncbi:MAG: Multidrug resistance protein MdtB [Deltaproteobacteria bacterium ADurb.Bin510]|nr:MAG: Multidrug resistance protein MdtB [Deltaproteobacteria bacterium ADurb.Bin510]